MYAVVHNLIPECVLWCYRSVWVISLARVWASWLWLRRQHVILVMMPLYSARNHSLSRLPTR